MEAACGRCGEWLEFSDIPTRSALPELLFAVGTAADELPARASVVDLFRGRFECNSDKILRRGKREELSAAGAARFPAALRERVRGPCELAGSVPVQAGGGVTGTVSPTREVSDVDLQVRRVDVDAAKEPEDTPDTAREALRGVELDVVEQVAAATAAAAEAVAAVGVEQEVGTVDTGGTDAEVAEVDATDGEGPERGAEEELRRDDDLRVSIRCSRRRHA